MLTIKKRVINVKKIEVEVINFKWCGEVSGKLQSLPCSACKKPIGEYKFGVAWINDGETKRSLRLCKKCGTIADNSVVQRKGE